MFKQALSEIRLYPGRFLATVIAIAISVAFMAAISIFVSTAQSGLSKSNSMALSQADLAVSLGGVVPAGGGPLDTIRGVDGVASATAVAGGAANVTTDGRSQLITLWADLPPEFRWADVTEGRYAERPGELTLAEHGAETLDVGLGDRVELMGESYEIVGLTRDAATMFGTVGYIFSGQPEQDMGGSEFIVKLEPGANERQVMAAVQGAIAPISPDATVQTAEDAMNDALLSTTQDLDILKYLLWVFAGIAVIVGMITIANTFTILLTQRRRQLALLRAVGATGEQVTARLVVESLLLGVLGSLLGVGLAFAIATLGAWATGFLFWGLSVNWGEIAIAIAVGVGATMVSAIAPALAAARVKPLEALQVVPTAAAVKRASRLRVVLCSVLFLAGVALVFLALRAEDEWAMAWAILGSGLLTVAVLAGAPLYIAPILRLFGRLLGGLGPTTRLALENSARNPRRAAATATALMLAIGLIVTLQVGLASTRSTAMAKIDEEFPLDIAATYYDGVPEGLADKVGAVDGVRDVALVKGKRVMIDTMPYTAIDDRARAELGVTANPIPDGTARFGSGGPTGAVTVGDQTLQVQHDQFYGWDSFGVNSATFDALPGEAFDYAVWAKLTDRSSPTALYGVLQVLDAAPGADMSNSGAQIAAILEQIINVILMVMTALLGVAVLIAIVGVGNTLGLSVLERQRESALLRALGMQRSQLRAMLLIEAFALVGIGAAFGFLAGAFFGWLGLTTVLGIAKSLGGVVIETRFALDPWWTLALVGVCVVSAVLASLLPGRKAANATPTEALAVE